jgi:hypothetical protein
MGMIRGREISAATLLAPPRYRADPASRTAPPWPGIVHQLRTGIPWRLLPVAQLGCGSPVTC